MEQAHWFIVAISVLADGSVSAGNGTLLESFDTRAACEAALIDEFDRGYSAGYAARRTDGAPQLVLDRGRGREVMQCLSPFSRAAGG